ncbi:hypothetical protein BDDG_11858 [Blastomyces dermatitidis ATCC 18188]|uniref:Uncharacterized protein n=1 Tax=Ajellomyces dermatitidis (strain ATCC 18188 / CBS 674.68) TaxID=653446 RepID=A0A0J9HD96_AJEDA|nr:hypothetical protein BDDG_11858 [Blastomyces dermatitidis ATCC 18188]
MIEREGSVTTVMREAENELNADELTGRRDDISLQGTAATVMIIRDAEEREDVTIRAVLL